MSWGIHVAPQSNISECTMIVLQVLPLYCLTLFQYKHKNNLVSRKINIQNSAIRVRLDASNFCEYWESHLCKLETWETVGYCIPFSLWEEVTTRWEVDVWVSSLMLEEEKTSVPVSSLLNTPKRDPGEFVIQKLCLYNSESLQDSLICMKLSI